MVFAAFTLYSDVVTVFVGSLGVNVDSIDWKLLLFHHPFLIRIALDRISQPIRTKLKPISELSVYPEVGVKEKGQ